MSKTFLKIKIMSLAAEAKIIRREEKKWPKPREGKGLMRMDLYFHRVGIVRTEARSAQLAYGYLRGRPYRRMEAKCYYLPDERRIVEMVVKFGQIDKKIAAMGVADWLAEPAEQMAKAA